MPNPKIAALVAFRNEERYLSSFLSHISPWVDGILCVDDSSTDSSYSIASSCLKVISVAATIEVKPDHANEVQNRKYLLKEAHRQGFNYVLCLDPDERLELRFLKRIRRIVEDNPASVHWLQVRDLWNSDSQYRVDGVWSSKFKPVLMPCYELGEYWEPGLHHRWTPPKLDVPALKVVLPYNLYHLRSIHKADRAKRVLKFNEVDKAKHYQADYDYLNSEQNMILESIPPGREYFR